MGAKYRNPDPFCRNCFLRLNDAYETALTCNPCVCTPGDFDRIYREFRQIQLQAHSMNHLVMEKYAQTVAGFARFLREQPDDTIHPRDQGLLLESIEFGRRCNGHDVAKCPSMHYDQLLLLKDAIGRQMQHRDLHAIKN